MHINCILNVTFFLTSFNKIGYFIILLRGESGWEKGHDHHYGSDPAIIRHFTDLETSTNQFSLKILNPDISAWSQQANEQWGDTKDRFNIP